MSRYVYGIDVSKWQGDIDWDTVMSHPDAPRYVTIKATQGVSIVDSKWMQNVQSLGAIRAGQLQDIADGQGGDVVGIGAYHYWVEGDNPVAQGEHFADAVIASGVAIDYAMIDCEGSVGGMSNHERAHHIKTVCDTVAHNLSLQSDHVQVYTSPGWWDRAVGMMSVIIADAYSLHVAHWTTGDSPLLPYGWNTWQMWQYTSSGHVNGIQSRVDMSRWNGNDRSLAAWLGYPTGDNDTAITDVINAMASVDTAMSAYSDAYEHLVDTVNALIDIVDGEE